MYYCEYCKYDTSYKANYKTHLKTKKHIENSAPIIPESAPIILSNIYTCDNCNFNYNAKNITCISYIKKSIKKVHVPVHVHVNIQWYIYVLFPILVTLDTSHFEISVLNPEAPPNTTCTFTSTGTNTENKYKNREEAVDERKNAKTFY